MCYYQTNNGYYQTNNEKIAAYNGSVDTSYSFNEDERKKFLRLISEAFSNVQKPPQGALLGKGTCDIGWVWEMAFLNPYQKWDDIPYYELWWGRTCFSALSDRGMRFMIPAYLKLFVTRPFCGELEDRLLCCLRKKGRGDLRLTSQQFSVVDEIFLKQREKWCRERIADPEYNNYHHFFYEELNTIALIRASYPNTLHKI